jgi:tetratricopeptide (TPR) repeat protein
MRTTLGIAVFCALLCAHPCAAAQPLTVEEFHAFQDGLQRLGTHALPGAALLDSTVVVPPPLAAPAGAPLQSMARSLRAISANVDSARVVTDHNWLGAIALARSLRDLGFRQRSLQWYERALDSDPDGTFTSEAVEEMAAVVIASADSAVLVQRIREFAGRRDAALHGDALATLLEALLTWRVGDATLALCSRLETVAAPAPSLRLAIARARELGGDPATALSGYRALLGESALDTRSLCRVRCGVADCAFALRDLGEAQRLYGEIQRTNAGDLSAWATYQLGSIAGLQGRYGEALVHFRSLCERGRPTRWQQEACWQRARAEELLAIRAGDRAPAAAAAHSPGGGS